MNPRTSNRFADPWGQVPMLQAVLLAFFGMPSMTVTVFFRRNLGYRVLRLWLIDLMFWMLIGYGAVTNLLAYALNVLTLRTQPFGNNSSSFHLQTGVFVFALLFLGAAIHHRRKGWRIAILNDWHTMSRGISWTADIFPTISEPRIQRWIEPTICVLVGVMTLFFSPAMGAWLIFAGASLWIVEAVLYDIGLNQMLDRHDARIEAKWANEAHKIGKAARAQLTARHTGGVPVVSLAPELEALLDDEPPFTPPDENESGPIAA